MNIAKKYEDVVAERDAALAREAALDDHLDAALRQVKANWDYAQDKQQRLTVAEQRAAVMEKALSRIAREHDCGCSPCTGSCTSQVALEITVDAMRDIAIAALKPAADSGFSSSEFTKKSGKSARAPVGLKKDQIVEVFGGGQTQIARVDKTDWRHVEMWRVKP